MEHFSKNTQGHCGVCGGNSCIRKNGTIENKNCCDKTAYDWIEDDINKPHCWQVPKNVPCSKTTPTPKPCSAPHCEVLRHNVFSQCGDIDEKLVENCKFDYCTSNKTDYVCSALERLADKCKKKGSCVEWRNLTNGLCDIPCPEGMIYDSCRRNPDDFCSGTKRIPQPPWDTMQSGCFCPHNQLLAEPHKQICVSHCTNCKGPEGHPMPAGSRWESNCKICTCNNQTLTEECRPKPAPPTPTCSPGSTLSSDCCKHPICVETICEYNGTKYKAGDTWTDPKSPCETFHCTAKGTEIEKTVCPQQFCPEELRVWDQDHCCYSCNTTCGVRSSNVTFENCIPEVTLPTCEGTCGSGSQWVRSETSQLGQLEQKSVCCRMKAFETKQIYLACNGGMQTPYSYKHITSCACQPEE
ncbi:mucin-5B [Clarias gariepinus]|uniref:mucin-5B n=1 Tax=Clarias gariepinus TaxID=13013 RepID=UPI00234CC230|nr:mucin-5B [Clarias gariepinus]